MQLTTWSLYPKPFPLIGPIELWWLFKETFLLCCFKFTDSGIKFRDNSIGGRETVARSSCIDFGGCLSVFKLKRGGTHFSSCTYQQYCQKQHHSSVCWPVILIAAVCLNFQINCSCWSLVLLLFFWFSVSMVMNFLLKVYCSRICLGNSLHIAYLLYKTHK